MKWETQQTGKKKKFYKINNFIYEQHFFFRFFTYFPMLLQPEGGRGRGSSGLVFDYTHRGHRYFSAYVTQVARLCLPVGRRDVFLYV